MEKRHAPLPGHRRARIPEKSRRGSRPLHPPAHRHAGRRFPRPGSRGILLLDGIRPEMDRPARNVRTDRRQGLPPRRPPRGETLHAVRLVLPRHPGPRYSGQSRREGPALPIPQVERTCADGRSRRTGSGMAAFGDRAYPGILRHEYRASGYLHGQLCRMDAAAGALYGRRVSGTHGGPRRHRPLPQFSGLPHQHGPHDRIRKGGLSAPWPHGTGRQLLPLQPHHAAHIAALRLPRHAGPVPKRRTGEFPG